MNPLVIILGVIVVFLSYKLYTIYTSAPTVASNVYLADGASAPMIVPSSSLTQVYSTKYTVAFWIYINTFSADIGKFMVFGKSLDSDVATSSATPASASSVTTSSSANNVFAFSMDPASPTLRVSILTGTATAPTMQDIVITDNFPLQTWTYVAVSVSTIAGSYADCYINGKLVVSAQLAKPPQSLYMASTSTDDDKPRIMIKKNPRVDVYMTRVTWLPYPVDPQTIWGYYNEGSGNPNGKGVTSAYHLDVNLSKDSDNYRWRLF